MQAGAWHLPPQAEHEPLGAASENIAEPHRNPLNQNLQAWDPGVTLVKSHQ